MSQITAAQLKAIAGAGARSDLIAAIVKGWPAAVAKAGLTNRLRAAHFLAQIMTETGGLAILEESGAYSTKRMLEIFGVGHHSAAITPDEARRIASLPVAQRGPVLFNRVYGVGNPVKMREFGNTGANDGWLYRGGGMMQATGKSNYAVLERKTGLPLVAHPELLHAPDSPFVAAYLEWAQGGRCNAAADRDDVVAVRKIINGGANGIRECRAYLAKAKTALAGYVADEAPATLLGKSDIEASEEGTAAEPAADVDLQTLQQRLRDTFHYNAGVPNGRWGGMTAGAIAGFINDRNMALAAPTSAAMFDGIAPQLVAEMDQAEAEGWARPVTAARASGELEEVAKSAPEVKPVHRNFLLAAWSSVLAFLSAIWDAVSDRVSAAWSFFTQHKDQIPADSGTLSTIWGYVEKVPTPVWWIAAAAGLALIALDARRGVQKITEQVQSGVRQ